jgi:hypothetical protein
MGAVGIHPMAVDNQQQYRTRESPAKHHITGGAGDAGYTLRGFVTGFVVQSTRAFYA